MKTVVILALNGTYSSCIHGLIETLLLKNNLLVKEENLSAPRIIIVSQDGEPVTDSYGKKFSVEKSIHHIDQCCFIIIPGIEHNSINTILHHSISSGIKNWLKHHYNNGTIICSHHTSIFILGESGLLNGKRCVCADDIEEKIEEQYPLVNIIQGPSLLLDQNIVTTTTAISWLSIAHLILYKKMETKNRKVETVDIKRIDVMSDIFPYINNLRDTIINNDAEFVIQAEQIIRNNNNIKTAQLADAIGVSTRTLHRRLKELTSETPKEFIDRVKVDYACELLSNSDKKIIDIAQITGFHSDAIFRKIFNKYTGITPTEYRIRQSRGKQSPKKSSLNTSVAVTPDC